MTHWQASASLDTLRQRAKLLAQIRDFFSTRDVLEVETPILSASTTCDPFIDSFSCEYEAQRYYLHTSPELPMKRLLSMDSGPIYQIAKVFREGESGAKHNPEFSLLEWYRPGFSLEQLMQEVDSLLKQLLADKQLADSEFFSYQYYFEKFLGINPHSAKLDDLYNIAKQHGLADVLSLDDELDRWLDLFMSHIIEPQLGQQNGQAGISFIYDYPQTQAALARIEKDANGQLVARRFEVYIQGMELANGFYELADSQEQRIRFEKENAQRLALGKESIPLDENFLAALDKSFPDCSGVALGIDRLMMLALNKSRIDEVISFSFERA